MDKLKKQAVGNKVAESTQVTMGEQTKLPRAPLPSQEQVAEWAKKDLHAAIHFLNVLLTNDDVFKVAVNAVYQYAVKLEQEQIALEEMEKQASE